MRLAALKTAGSPWASVPCLRTLGGLRHRPLRSTPAEEEFSGCFQQACIARVGHDHPTTFSLGRSLLGTSLESRLASSAFRPWPTLSARKWREFLSAVGPWWLGLGATLRSVRLA
jgi:hypothetical protein